MTDIKQPPSEHAPQVAEAPRVLREPPPPRSGGFFAGLKRLGSFFVWIITGFGLLGALRRHRSARFKVEEISVYCVHRSFFLWALILTGFVGAFAVHHHGRPLLWGWVYIWVLLYTLLTVLFDINSLKF